MTPTKPTCPPGRVERIACIIDSCVPTASIMEWDLEKVEIEVWIEV